MNNRKIIAYKYVGCERMQSDEFEHDMKENIKEGWQPYGSPMLEYSRGEDADIFFWQAMVKYERT